jgi:hypothetical protein
VFFNSVQGGKNYYLGSDNLLYGQFGSGFNNISTDEHYNLNFPKGLDYWLPENPDAKYQRIDMHLASALVAVRWLQRNFVRLQDITLSYDVESKLLKKLDINNLRVYMSGKNLFTWTKWTGWDPETGEGITSTGRPVLKSYSFGLNIEF